MRDATSSALAALAHRRRLGADRMNTADALMVVYYVVLSGVMVFTLGYLADWRDAKRRQ